MASTMSLLDAMKVRRSIYALAHESPISDDRIVELVQHAMIHCPSTFNVQSARAVVLLGDSHYKLWDLAAEVYKAAVGPEKYPFFAQKIAEYRTGYGTVLFYEDPNAFKITETMLGPSRWPLVKERCPEWAEHSSGMHQYAVWTALCAEGLGCNLQHYNPLLDTRIAVEWNIPAEWSLRAQLVFGKPTGPPRGEPKKVVPVEERVFVHKG